MDIAYKELNQKQWYFWLLFANIPCIIKSEYSEYR